MKGLVDENDKMQGSDYDYLARVIEHVALDVWRVVVANRNHTYQYPIKVGKKFMYDELVRAGYKKAAEQWKRFIQTDPENGRYFLSGHSVDGEYTKHRPSKTKENKAMSEAEKKKGADGKACWKGYRYAGTEKGKDKCVPVKESAYEADLDDNEPRVVIGVYGAKSKEFRKKFPNQQAQDRFFDHPDRKGNFEIHYVQKANMAEGVIIGHDKDDPEVAVLGGAGSYNLSNLKKKAHSEATMLANDISKGSFKSAAYNVKQLANTLETIKAAEDEMEKSYFGEGDEMLDEAKMSDIVSPLVKQFNLENGAEARWANMIPLQVKHSFRRWRRGDGSYYTDPSRIEAFSTEYKGLQSKFFDWLLQQSGVRPAGKIRGEFRSDDYSDAVKYKGLIFINRGAYTEFTTTSRLRNSDVWHQKTDEDYTGMFAAEKTAATNPYGGQTDRQYRGALGEDYKTRPITPALRAAQKNMAGLASGEIQRQEKQRKADEKAQRQASQYLDRVLNRKPAKKSKQDLETLWAKIESVIANSFPDGDPYDSLWPYMQKNGFTQDDVERASKMHGYDDLWDYWNTLTQDIENDAYYDWHATGGKNVRTRGTFVETPTDNPTGASGEGGWRRTDLDEYREMSPELRAAQKNLIALRNKEKSVNVSGKRERVSKEPSTDDKPKPASVLTKGAQEVDPAVADAIAAFLAKGGEIKKGRPGKAPPTGRQQASKHIGGGGKYRKRSDTPGQGANYRGAAIVAVEEEQIDEKCWTGYKQVGMKKKGDRMVPNCVQKESAIMKGLKRESK
jgi:hypothetical protein